MATQATTRKSAIKIKAAKSAYDRNRKLQSVESLKVLQSAIAILNGEEEEIMIAYDRHIRKLACS